MMNLADTPAGMIARLDAALARRGQDIILRKTNSTVGQITVRAVVRRYEAKEIIGNLRQGDREVIISATGLETFGVPPMNGFAVIDGVPCTIIGAYPKRPAGTLVRVKMDVRG